MKKRLICFYIFLVLSVATFTFILVQSGLTGSESSEQSGWVSELFIKFVALINPDSCIVKNPETTHGVIRKLIGHFGLFAIGGIFTVLTFNFMKGTYKDNFTIKVISLFSIGLMFAFISELIQLATPNRAFAFTDVLIDYAGYLSFGGLTYLFCYLHQRKQLKEKTT